jgi:hypothetical protein
VLVHGTAADGAVDPGQLAIDGLLIEGIFDVAKGNLGRLALSHTTVVPATGGLTVLPAGSGETGTNEALEIDLLRTICGPIQLAPTVARLDATDSIIDDDEDVAIDATDLSLEACTVLGSTHARSLEASNCIFTRTVTVDRRQTGCVRFSYVQRDSLVPKRFHCLPATDADAVRVQPAFESALFGDPSYCQLAAYGPREIATGADDEGEIGVFKFLMQHQRTESLRARLDEYLRFGLEAGVFYVT